jgi:hypothetical protein
MDFKAQVNMLRKFLKTQKKQAHKSIFIKRLIQIMLEKDIEGKEERVAKVIKELILAKVITKQQA